MPVFEYKAINKDGKKIGGILTADGPAAARLKLSQDLIFPMEIKESKATQEKSPSESFLSNFPGFHRINPVEVSTALRQLATLVSSGLPLLECLTGMIEQVEQTPLKKIFTQIRERVLEGGALFQAMTDHPSVFNQIAVNMVKAGEAGGALDIILKRLADFSEKRLKLKKKVEAAMAYPMFLLMISSIILIFLMSFVMPKVISIFQGMELALPWSTRTLIWVTHIMKQFWWLIILGLIALFTMISLWTKTNRGGRIWDRTRLRVPLLGRLHHKAVIARFTRTLSILLNSGITLVDSLEIARLAMGNRIMEDAIADTAKLVEEGSDFSTPLKNNGRFPPLVVQLIKAGEMSGELEEMLAKAAEVYEDEVEATIASLTAIMEPVIILVMGFVVGFMVMAILLPILDMTGAIK